MGFHQRARIERLETIEQTIPKDRDQAGRNQQLGEFHERVAFELAALDGTAQDAAERLEKIRDSTSR